ncbi:hypothetical protein [Dyella sp. 2HG41-7]|uniref:hypothetical protein n=1 Tax=Dyella sp. 2HG41-7 TaxID=2883239 RepID=UPI001F21F9A8|nr:hypothetical protein [Dyella sp. 2HG41-7]
MNASVELQASDLEGLERVAVGRGASVPGHVADRLWAMGLLQKIHAVAGTGAELQLTSNGLSIIRSSDQ